MKVDKYNLLTTDEYYDYLIEELFQTDNFLPWEVHPNKLRVAKIKERKLCKKLAVLLSSEEYKYFSS